MEETYTITKKIAKHGSQSVIIIPKILQSNLKPRTLVKVKIDVLKEAKDDIESEDL